MDPVRHCDVLVKSFRPLARERRQVRVLRSREAHL